MVVRYQIWAIALNYFAYMTQKFLPKMFFYVGNVKFTDKYME